MNSEKRQLHEFMASKSSTPFTYHWFYSPQICILYEHIQKILKVNLLNTNQREITRQYRFIHLPTDRHHITIGHLLWVKNNPIIRAKVTFSLLSRQQPHTWKAMDSSQDLTWSNKLVSGDKMSVSLPCHSPLLDRKDYSSLALPSFLSGGHPPRNEVQSLSQGFGSTDLQP